MLTQKEPVSHFITVEGYQVHVTEWGIDKPKSILLWHGFERNGRDFDHLAESLAKEYRVLCPDTIGRGLSQWASKPEDSYCFDLYEKLALKICEVFGFFNLDFLGTGMGGALGIRLASGPLQQNINHLIINDAAPQVEIDGLNRILSYSANPISFTAPQDYEDHLRSIYDGMGYLSDAQWRALTLSSLRRRDDGTITVDFDPGITEQFFDNLQDYDLWDSYQKITCPTLILRGQSSDILTAEVFAKMCEVNENATGVEFPNCGHAPALNKDQQIYVIEEFLKMTGDDHIKQLLKDGLSKFDLEDQLNKIGDPRTQAPDQVPSFDELGYEYETNPVLKERVEKEIAALKKKDGLE